METWVALAHASHGTAAQEPSQAGRRLMLKGNAESERAGPHVATSPRVLWGKASTLTAHIHGSTKWERACL